MKKTILFLTAMLFVVLSTFFGCAPTDENLIRLNEVTHSIFYAPQYLAESLGYFEEAGLKVELTNGGGSDKSMTALLSNEADVALMGPETVIFVSRQGRKDQPMIFGQLTKRDGSFLIGRTDEPNFDYSGLNGKEIIMGRKGGLPAMTLQYVLNQKGYRDGENITMNYDIQFNLTGPAFTSGQGDYVALFEPTASQLVNEGKGYVVSSVGAASGEVPYTAYIATKSYIEKHPQKLEKFLTCIHKATNYLLTHDNAEVAALLLPHFVGTSKVDIQNALQSYRNNDTWVTAPSMKESSFERLQDIMQNAGELTQRMAFSAAVDNSVADRIR